MTIEVDTDTKQFTIDVPDDEMWRAYMMHKLRQMVDRVDNTVPVAEPGSNILRPQFRPPPGVLKGMRG